MISESLSLSQPSGILQFRTIKQSKVLVCTNRRFLKFAAIVAKGQLYKWHFCCSIMIERIKQSYDKWQTIWYLIVKLNLWTNLNIQYPKDCKRHIWNTIWRSELPKNWHYYATKFLSKQFQNPNSEEFDLLQSEGDCDTRKTFLAVGQFQTASLNAWSSMDQ